MADDPNIASNLRRRGKKAPPRPLRKRGGVLKKPKAVKSKLPDRGTFPAKQATKMPTPRGRGEGAQPRLIPPKPPGKGSFKQLPNPLTARGRGLQPDRGFPGEKMTPAKGGFRPLPPGLAKKAAGAKSAKAFAPGQIDRVQKAFKKRRKASS